MSETISVDLDRLETIGQQLVALAATLEQQSGKDFATRVAQPELAKALRSVQDDWSKKRKQIVEYLRTAGEAAKQSAATYRSTDSAIAAAARPGGAP